MIHQPSQAQTIPSLHPLRLTDLMRSRPGQVPLTCALLGINVAVFALMLMNGAGLWHTSHGIPLAWGANFGPATQDGQWWRLLTALFIHFGVVHLALNMWALWDVGRLVERVYGRWQFALLYLGSGVIGNLLSLVVQGNQAVSGGASGAVFSLYGALLVFLWRERRQVERGEFRWLFGGALVFTLLMLGMGWLIPGIDNAAHGGGLLAGALLGRLLSRPWTPDSDRGLRGRWWAALLLVVLTAGLMLRIPAPSYRFGEELKAREAIQQFLSQDQRISQRWGAILDHGRREGLSFEVLAGRIDSQVATVYEQSFEALMAASPGADVPSTKTLEALQTYASLRAEASRELVDGLRRNDREKIQKALAQAKRAQAQAVGVSPSASSAAQSASAPD